MNKLFTPTVKKVLFESVFIALLVFLTQNYLQRLWAPETAARTLKKENYISSKRDSYFEAINIVDRAFSGFKFTDDSAASNIIRIKGTTYPTEYEVNSCLSKLYLYTNNQDIINSFKNIFLFKDGTAGNFVKYKIQMLKAIKSDLSDERNSKIINTYEYIMVNTDTTFH